MKTMFDHVPFGQLGHLLDLMGQVHDDILIAGNLQPSDDEYYWKKGSDAFKCIVNIMEKPIREYLDEKENSCQH